jgi:hypothetical protein
VSHPVDPIEASLREMDLASEQEQEKENAVANEVDDLRWLMSHVRGRRIARALIKKAPPVSGFSSNFGHMSWLGSRAAFIDEHLVKPMRAASLELFHQMELEADDS